MPNPKHETLMALAAERLGQHFGTSVSLNNPRSLQSQHTMLRCEVHGEGLPPSVILKQIVKTDEESDAPAHFRNEWASLEFLTTLSVQPPVGPRLYTSDQDAALIIMEDLGDLPTVQDVLLDKVDGDGEGGLVHLGAYLGNMQAASFGKEAQFTAIQAGLGTRSPLSDSTLDLRDRADSLRDCFAGIKVELSGDFSIALDALESTILGPGPLRVFSHCDAGSHNFLYEDHGVRLMDFEYGSYAFGLLDIVPARLGFPPSFHSHRVTPEIVDAAEKAYREGLAAAIPEIMEEHVFHLAVAQACAHWAYSRIAGLWRNYLEQVVELGEERAHEEMQASEDRIIAFRNKVYTYVSGFVHTSQAFDLLPELRKPAKGFLNYIRKQWPETELIPFYPGL